MSDDFPTVSYASSNARIWWVVGVVAVLVLVAGGIALRIAFTRLPPGTTVAGEVVATPAEAVEVAEDIGARLTGLSVELRTAAGDTTIPAGQLGAELETDPVRTAAEEARGFDGWLDRYTGGGTVELPVEVTVTEGDLSDAVAAVSAEPVDGAIDVTATGVDVTDPVPGVEVTEVQIREAVTPELERLATTPAADWPSPLVVELDGTEIEPVVTQASVDAAVAEIERITSTPIEVTASVVPEDSQTVDGQMVPLREPATLTLQGADLRGLLATEVDPDAIQRERLQIVADVEDPPSALADFVEAADVPPEMDVSVENRSPTPERGGSGEGPGGPADQPRLADVSGITGDLVATVNTPGLDADLAATAEAVVRAAVEGETSVAVQGTPINSPDPALLDVVEPVSTYTTFYTPGEGRVTNIHRIAEIVDGTLVPPGGNLDVNHGVGERTAERGFVPAGAILEGEFVSDVGGGVSQFGTTFFNAMWFAGVDIITHTPHSYWFDRYPAGREATIDYPGVDLEFNNNTPYWILVDTAVTADSVTVTFWSTRYFAVEQTIGPREPVQGGDFRITIERVATAPPIPELELEGFVDDDRFTHTYGTPP